MHLNFSINSLTNFPSDLVAVALGAGCLWLVILGLALWREDFDPVTKFMWVFVIVAIPIFGALLYLLIAPKQTQVSRAKSEHENEPTTCVNCRTMIAGGSSVCPKCGWTYLAK